jgi:DNA-binding FrmR family transcriptional regulator
MLDSDLKRSVHARLRRVAGQLAAIERMVEADRYCVDLMHQIAAVQAALGEVGKVVLESHVQRCVADAMRTGSAREKRRKIDELMTVFSRYGQLRER